MVQILSYDGVLAPLGALKPLFRSDSLARAFAKKLVLTRRLEPITRNGRLVVIRAYPWDRQPKENADLGNLAGRLSRVAKGEELFEILRDGCLVGLRYQNRRFDLLKAVWNNYIIWFNSAADARVPRISDFKHFGADGDAPNNNLDVPDDNEPYVVFGVEEIFGLRLTDGGVGLQELLGKRPTVTNWAEADY